MCGFFNLKFLKLSLRNTFIGTQFLETNGFIGFDQISGYFVPDLSFCFNCIDNSFLSGLNPRVNFQDSHKMSKTGFLFQPFKDFTLFILGQDPTCSQFNDINLTKQVAFVLFIDFSFTDKDVEEAFLY